MDGAIDALFQESLLKMSFLSTSQWMLTFSLRFSVALTTASIFPSLLKSANCASSIFRTSSPTLMLVRCQFSKTLGAPGFSYSAARPDSSHPTTRSTSPSPSISLASTPSAPSNVLSIVCMGQCAVVSGFELQALTANAVSVIAIKDRRA